MSTVCFYAQFTASKLGVNSLTVTWDVERITRSDGTRSALVTGGANSITVGRRGLYGYVLTGADLATYDYVATAITATTTVDAQEVPALWTLWSDTAPDSSGVTTLLSRLTSARAGYLDLLNSYLDSAVSAIKTVVDAVKAKTDNLPTDPADESLIEAAITAATSPLATSSALAAVAGYVDTEVAAIKAKTDNLPLDPASMADVQTALDALAVPDNAAIAAIQAKTDNLPIDPASMTDVQTALDALASPENITVNAVVAISAIEAEQLHSGELAIKMHYATRQSIHSTIMYDLSAATKLWIACKRRMSIQTPDDKSLFFVEKTDGLVYLDKEIYATPEHGSLTITGEPGNWDIVFYLHQDAASLLEQYVGDDCVMEMKALVSEIIDPVYITGGRCEFSVGVVQAVE
jgi:hypothetical protein